MTVFLSFEIFNTCNFSENSCRTIGGPSPGVPCLFPFKYADITYWSCAMYMGQLVCATEVDNDGNAINYGVCGTNCPQ